MTEKSREQRKESIIKINILKQRNKKNKYIKSKIRLLK